LHSADAWLPCRGQARSRSRSPRQSALALGRAVRDFPKVTAPEPGGLSPGTSSSASLGECPGFARGRRWRRGHRFLNLSFASLAACRSALRRSFVASASRCSRSCTSVSWRLACAIHSMYSIHVGTSSSELRNVSASSSNRTPAEVAIIVESFAPRKDCRQRIDGGALRGTRHVTRSCVFGGPARLTFMGGLYAWPLRRGKLTHT
jgi:hypothetical protein